jgi:hypothetical protein
VIFLQEKDRVIDEELAHLALPDGPHRTGVVLIGEIEAVVSGRAGRAIEKPEALLLVLHLTASVVVDDVEQHGHTMEVEELNYCFELVSRGGQHGFP